MKRIFAILLRDSTAIHVLNANLYHFMKGVDELFTTTSVWWKDGFKRIITNVTT